MTLLACMQRGRPIGVPTSKGDRHSAAFGLAGVQKSLN